MSDVTTKSDLVITEELTKAIQSSLNPDDIRAAFAAEAQKQNLGRNTDGVYVADPAKVEADRVAAEKIISDKAAADKAVADKATADAAASAGNTEETPFKRTENINGRDFEFEAASELELERMIANAYRVAYGVQRTAEEEPEAVVDQTAKDLAEKAAREAETVAKAELELRFKRGEISASDYLEQSGAMDEYLSKKGIPVEELKQTVEDNRNKGFEQSWADATTTFLQSPAGADWPGGERNKKQLGRKLAELGLVDAQDKVAAMAQAYAELKRENMLFVETPVVQKTETVDATKVAADAAAKIAADKVVADAAAVVAAEAAKKAQQTQRTSSSVFGASSGTSAQDQKDKPPAGSAVEVPKDATPQEIIAAWKASVMANGQDPNAVFTDTFAGKK